MVEWIKYLHQFQTAVTAFLVLLAFVLQLLLRGFLKFTRFQGVATDSWYAAFQTRHISQHHRESFSESDPVIQCLHICFCLMSQVSGLSGVPIRAKYIIQILDFPICFQKREFLNTKRNKQLNLSSNMEYFYKILAWHEQDADW